ncbi:unnamed protein product [Oppiella nova]|uniref:Ketosynthase family 3 (KS3) domain-containing protein n=1 Tax=Oppiella nova TaxID=334625 RepID=A0A7R9QSR3_9ACAR|nr:unnamed protein product [Oppiella nova]CAG2174339.1 unnamed protein product [Oppiella nova]
MSADDIILSGMSGRFPLAVNTDEFAKNLFDGIDMVTDDDSRWPMGLYDISNRMGKIDDYKLFDSTFFGLMDQMVDEIDPQSRMLLETSYEAMCDAGLNPQTLRGSRTGVYVGVSQYAMTDGYPEDVQPDSRESLQTIMLQNLSNMKTFYASRISFANDFKGPSMIVDTACSASLTAMCLAVNDLKLGYTDSAIVCGTHMVFEPFINQYQQELSVCSPRGVSAVLDQEADGFVKAEAVCCLFLQRRRDARRNYAHVRSARMNVDGHKKMGMFFPSSEAHEQLMRTSYEDCNIDPRDMTYFECHATGTKAGDPQEIKAIYNTYCKSTGRTDPLPIGVLKSNMGHAEAGSGVSSVIKMMISYENECIPPNINLNTIKDEIAQYFPPLLAIKEKYPYKPGIFVCTSTV